MSTDYKVENYISDVVVTESKPTEELKNRLGLFFTKSLKHSLLIASESASIADMHKKYLYYGKLPSIEATNKLGPLMDASEEVYGYFMEGSLPDDSPKINSSDKNIRLLHGIIGLFTEAGELIDAIRDALFNDGEIDEVNLGEEVGDALWYIAIILDVIGVDFNKVMDINIKKLKARYPDAFNAEKAINRDLETEREILDDIIL